MDLLNQLRTVAWYHSIAKALNAKSIYEVSNAIDEMRLAKSKSFVADTKSFAPYVNGKVLPNDGTVAMVQELLPDTAAVFHIGPASVSGNAPLWLALGGSPDTLGNVLTWFDKDMGMMLVHGATVSELVHHVMDGIFPREIVSANFEDALKDPLSNEFARGYEKGLLPINLDQITVVLALWRLCMLNHSYVGYMNYFVLGLGLKAVPDHVNSYGITKLLREYLGHIDTHYWHYLKKMTEGKLTDDDDPIIRFVS